MFQLISLAMAPGDAAFLRKGCFSRFFAVARCSGLLTSIIETKSNSNGDDYHRKKLNSK